MRFLRDTPSVPVLPGDHDLAKDILVDMETYLHNHITNNKKTSPPPEIARQRLHGPGLTLLHLVIVRTYLQRQPEDDDHIFDLWNQERIVRSWTYPEVIFAASQGMMEEDLRSSSDLAYRTTRSDRLIKYGGDLPQNSGIIHIQSYPDSSDPYVWPPSSSLGLTGEPLVIAEIIPRGPPPKPRPFKKQASVHFADNHDVASGDISTILTPGNTTMKKSSHTSDGKDWQSSEGKRRSVRLKR